MNANANGVPTATQVALDLVLAEAAASTRERFLPGREAVRLGAALARRPKAVVRRGAHLGREISGVLAGRSGRGPAREDRRFSDPAWSTNWALRRLLQGYLAAGETVDALLSDAALEWADDRKLRFVAQNLIDALAPTNFALTNPEVLKTAIDTGGSNFVDGLRQLAGDVRRPPRLPRNVDQSKFKVGENLALSPGAVVMRSEGFELIQYQPTTPEVRQTPLLIVPPMINKFYITDLAPGKSLVEYLVAQGQQVFSISWRNPEREHRDWDLDHYAAAVLGALDAVESITASERTHVVGNCAGGLLAASLCGHLAAAGGLDRIASLTLGVCVIDNERSNVVDAMATPPLDQGRDRGLGPQGLPRRRRAREHVPVAASERPRVAVRRQQLAARQGAASVRHPLLERGHDAAPGRAAPRLHGDRQRKTSCASAAA
jgi:poly[(R)-3-hydroxyalkanoate] polymerase subunit PhaC